MQLRYVGVVVLLLCSSVARGDGCYIPQKAVRTIPEIAAQRAILSWKDGVETLVIESALDSEAQSLGWIIPVPSVPQSIEKGTPGTLKTLDFCIQPKIVHDLYLETRATVMAVIIVNLLAAAWLFERKRFGCLLFLIVFAFFLGSMTLAAGSGGNVAARTSEALVAKTATVGSYVVSVLKPSEPAEMDNWLAANSFAHLPEAAVQTVADYISEGWVFAAIKLTRSEAGLNVPHPIRLVFASKEAVYPLRLTAVAGGSPDFRLFVIGADCASCDMLLEEFCDRFSRKNYEEVWYEGTSSGCQIGHAAVCSRMWDGCVLTKFSGTIDAASMTKDLHFTWTPFKAHQERFFTRLGAGRLAVILFALVAGVWNILSMRDYAKGLVQPRERRTYVLKRLLPAIGVGLVIAVSCFAAVPKLDTGDVRISYDWGSRWLRLHLRDQLKNSPDMLQRTETEIAEFLLNGPEGASKYDGGQKNTITGLELKVEDSPGNFTVEKNAKEVVVRVYGRNGSVSTETFPTGIKDSPKDVEP